MVFGGGQRRLEVLLELRDRFTAGIKNAAASAESFSDRLKKATPVLLAMSGAVAGIGGAAIKFASDLEESTNKANVTFGDASDAIQTFAKTSGGAFGISQRAANEYTATLGNILQASGLSQKATAGMSIELTKLAADLASFNNIPVDEALLKLRSGLVGQAEPLRTVGVLLSEAAVQAKAMELGLGGASGELTEGAKVVARYQLIMEQTTNAQGDFTRTSAGLANQMRIAKAQMEDAAASLGTALIPATSKALQGINLLVKGFAELPQGVQLAGLGILGATGALAALGVVIPRIIEGVRLLARVINTELVVAFVRLAAPIAAVAATFMIAKSTGEALLNALDNLLLGTKKETDAWKLMQRDIDFLDHKLQDLVGSVFKSVGASGEASDAASDLSNDYKNLLGDLSNLGGSFKKVSDEVVANVEHMTTLDRKLIDFQDTTRNAAFIQEHIAETYRKAQEQAAIYEGVASLAAESIWNIGVSAKDSAVPGLEELRAAMEQDTAEVEAFGAAASAMFGAAEQKAFALTEAVRNQTFMIDAMVASADAILGGGVAPGGLHKGRAFDVPALPWDPAWGTPPPGIPIAPFPSAPNLPANINEGVTINFNGPVYGMNDFDDRVNQAVAAGRRRGVS